MNAKTLIARLQPHRSMHFVHRFSDSLLHTGLLVAIVLLTGLTLYQAIGSTLGLVWQLEPVVVHAPAKR